MNPQGVAREGRAAEAAGVNKWPGPSELGGWDRAGAKCDR
jgi:hypothetical protein